MLQVAILAGGLATRLRPLTETIPKSLISINGVPFVAHQLRLLRQHGVQHVVLCVGNLGEMIQDYVADGEAFDLTVDYSWDGPVPLGTAGAVMKALPLLDEAFFVMYGDSYLPCNYQAIESAFLRSGKEGLMTVFRNEGQWGTSNIEFRDGCIKAHDKRLPTAQMQYIDYGLGVFARTAFAGLPSAACDLTTVFQGLLARRELAAFEVAERFYEAGSFEGIQTLSEFLAKDINNRDT